MKQIVRLTRHIIAAPILIGAGIVYLLQDLYEYVVSGSRPAYTTTFTKMDALAKTNGNNNINKQYE
ncbi:MAG: hypothetical protein NC217_04570 [Muribaculaceae bacterium]|nr:hypothetical protein [Muribaculaceae bacterium]